MRKMPQLSNGNKQTRMTTTFMGYNHNEIIEDGELYDTKNLSSDVYPMLIPRKKRAYASYVVSNENVPITGIDGREKLTHIVGSDVYYDFQQVTGLTVSAAADMCPKKIVNFGAYVCIWPDKVYFNTINDEDCGSMERLWPAADADPAPTVTQLCMCRGDGTDYAAGEITVSKTAPSNPDNGKLWIDQSGDNDVLRQYSSALKQWVEVATTFVKISGTGIGTGLNIYDAINISGLSLKELVNPTDAQQTAWEKKQAQLQMINGSKIVYYGGEDYIVVVGLLSETVEGSELDDTVTQRADRTIPDMDYIVESNNRLWGCKYGVSNGQVINEIRASALGDFRNWERFLGNSQDSYKASVGTDGPFTGAVTLKNYPVFFKESCIHEVHGTAPASFQVSKTMCRGVQKGSWRSAVVVNEKAYYKSRTGVMMYDGAMPVFISEQLGDTLYSDARAGALGAKYYISMQDAGGTWYLFTYETEKGIWYKEDHFKALGFGRVADELYGIDEVNARLVGMTGNVEEPDAEHPIWTVEDAVSWEAIFGISGIEYGRGNYGARIRNDTPGSRYISRFDIRMYLGEDSQAKLWIQYNDDGIWRDKGEIRGNRLRSFVLPVVPVRCDHLRFKLTGTGEMRIYSICRIMEVGSDGGIY